MNLAIPNARILVADDELSIRTGCSRILIEQGLEVVAVTDGIEAIEEFKKNKFDVVLLDLSMPILDGIQAIPKLLEIEKDVVIVMITGYASFETAVKAIQLGAYDYIPKPFTPQELLIVVNRALEKRKLLLEQKKLQLENQRYLKDITLEKSRLKTILNFINEPIFIINNLNEIVFYNLAFLNSFINLNQYSKDSQIESEKSIKLKVEEIPNQNLINIIKHASQNLSLENPAMAKEIYDEHNNKFWLASLAIITDNTTNYINKQSTHFEEKAIRYGLIGALSDITALKELDKAKTRFVSIVAHELKAPLAAIEGYLDLIISELDDNQNQQSFVTKLYRCKERVNQLTALIKDLLDITRIETGRIDRNLQKVNLVSVIQNNIEFYKPQADKRNIIINFSISGTNSEVYLLADVNELHQIFSNLISNAIKYNKDNGSINIELIETNIETKVSVSDTGIGIPKEQIKNIGLDFYRIKNSNTINISGTGLGISIVKRLLKFYNAKLDIISEENVGSTFTISFPKM